ncbi:MAG: flagellar hook assembly protein FlgD [Rhizobiaceae bacterium]
MDSIAPLSQPTRSPTAASAANVDYQTFLRLLVAEMRNQDPTKPMESTEYIAQLASFSNVEQNIQLNSKLDMLLSASYISQADALIGREITSPDGEVSGTVVEVKVYDDGLIAVLDTGEELIVGGGVKIS